MNQPTHIRAEYWGIEVPEGIVQPTFHLQPSIINLIREEVGTSELIIKYTQNVCGSPEGKISIHLPSTGPWQIICLSGEVTERQAKEIVEPHDDLWKNYESEPEPYAIAANSLKSLLRSKNLPINTTLILKKL